MSLKRAKKKKQKQLEQKHNELDVQVETAEETQQEDETGDEAANQDVTTQSPCQESDEKSTEDSTENDEAPKEDDTESEAENDDSTEAPDEQELLEQQEKEEFADMMQAFKIAVESANEKDPDEETLIRLFGESNFESSKEKVIENPEELIDEADKPKSYLGLRILYTASAVLFVGVLLIFGIVSIFDKDKLVSESENRTLAKRPEFSVATLFDGKYTVEFENYYSDNFPGREFFIGVNSKLKDVFTRFSTGENSDVIISVDKTDDDFAGEGVDLGNKPQPEEEQTQVEESTTKPVIQEPVSIKGSLVLSGNRAMEIFTYGEKSADRYAAIVNKTAKAMPEGVKFYSLIAPTAVEFYGTDSYTTGKHSQLDAIKKVYAKMDAGVIKVDAYSAIAPKSDEYIYFRTDLHWTARGAYYAYTSFCKSAGLTAPELSAFPSHEIDGFVGSLYRTSQAEILKKNPDKVECFDLLVEATNTVYNSAAMNGGIQSYIVANKVNGSNKYLAFISGDQPLEKITTNVKNGKKILVIKESFGNAFVPFLCNIYEEVYVVDPRQIDMYLPDFVKNNGIQEVLAINYSFGISNSKYCKELDKLTTKVAK